MTTDGEMLIFCAENIRVLELIRKTRASAAIPAGTIIGPVIEVHIVKILDECGIEVAIPTICRAKDTPYVVVSREIECFVNEIHRTQKQKSSPVMNCSNIFKNQKEMSFTKKEG